MTPLSIRWGQNNQPCCGGVHPDQAGGELFSPALTPALKAVCKPSCEECLAAPLGLHHGILLKTIKTSSLLLCCGVLTHCGRFIRERQRSYEVGRTEPLGAGAYHGKRRARRIGVMGL
jgi:hypothetical protein